MTSQVLGAACQSLCVAEIIRHTWHMLKSQREDGGKLEGRIQGEIQK